MSYTRNYLGGGKLVRDKIPGIARRRGDEMVLHQVFGEPYLDALKRKLIEEAYEVAAENSKEAVLEELADMTEVILALLEHLGIEWDKLDSVRELKKAARGGFEHGFILTRCVFKDGDE